MTEKSLEKILSEEANVREKASKAFALAVITEGLKPVADDEEQLDRPTALESIAARLWLSAAQGDMKAIAMLRDTLDGVPVQETKLDAASAAIAGAAAGATAAIISRIEGRLLSLKRPEPETIEAKVIEDGK